MTVEATPGPAEPVPPAQPANIQAWIRAYNLRHKDDGHGLVSLPQRFTVIEHEFHNRRHHLAWVRLEGDAPGGRNHWSHYLLCDCWIKQDGGQWLLPATHDYGRHCSYILGQCRQQLGLLQEELLKSYPVTFGYVVGEKEASDRALILAVMWEIGADRFVGNPLGGQVTISDLVILLGNTDREYIDRLLRPLEALKLIGRGSGVPEVVTYLPKALTYRP